MNLIPAKHRRVLSIAPSTRGFGYAVIEGEHTFLDWGVKAVKGDKNAESLAKANKLLTYYKPDVLVIQDLASKDCRRAPRIQKLGRKIIGLASRHKVKVAIVTRTKVRQVFLGSHRGTKYAIAQTLVQQFPEELGSRLPPKRKPWLSEDSRMDIFDAVALALMVGKGGGRAYGSG